MDNGEVLLKAAEATITTCTVTIQVIRINKRQLTFGTFKQMPCKPLFDEKTLDGATIETIWGWVNYTPKNEWEQYTQFVVQKSGRLARCPFWVRRLDKERTTWPKSLTNSVGWAEWDAGLYLLTTALEGTLVYHEEEGNSTQQCYQVDLGFPFGQCSFRPGGVVGGEMLQVAHSIAIREALKPEPYMRWSSGPPDQRDVEFSADEVREKARQTLRKMITEFVKKGEGHLLLQGDPMIFTSAFWRRRIDDRVRKAADYVKRWNDLMVQLADVEQLYIAT